MNQYHAIVWVDHQVCRVFHVDSETADKITIHSDYPHQKLHHKAGTVGDGHAHEDPGYYRGIMDAFREAGEILIVGPGQAKQELFEYIQRHDPGIAKRVVGVEPLDHLTDGQLVAFARKSFKVIDRMLPQR